MSAHPLIEQLKAERIRRGLSLEQAAAAADISRTTLSHWESGDKHPTLPLLDAYTASLDLCLKAAHVVEDFGNGEQIPFEDEVIGLGEKWCGTCAQIRSVRDFHQDRSNRDGLYRRCKHCRKDRTEALRGGCANRAEASTLAAAKARASRSESALERLERYAELRRGGFSRQEAAWELGISRRQADRYEAQLRQQAQQEVAA